MAFVVTSITALPKYSTRNRINAVTPGDFHTPIWNAMSPFIYPDGPTGSYNPVTFQIPDRVGPFKVPLSLQGTFNFDINLWGGQSYVVYCVLPARGGQLANSMVLVSDPIRAPMMGLGVVVSGFNLLKPDFRMGLPRLPFRWAGDFIWTIMMASNPGT